MEDLSKGLREAMESDCAHSLEKVMVEKSPEDFHALQRFLSMDASIAPLQRLKALHLLGRWEDPASVPAIIRILPQLNEIGRSRAIDALGRLGSTEAMAAIFEHADDPSANVRKFVVHAMSRTNVPEAIKKLKEIEESDDQPFIRDLARKHRTK